MTIVDAIYSYLPAKRKQTPSGWTKFNAVCCIHNNNTSDTRQRGGIIRNSDGISYHCFNCGYKASYVAGRALSRKMRHLLGWLGMPDDMITKLSLEALKIESDEQQLQAITLPRFENKSLPENSRSFEEWQKLFEESNHPIPKGFVDAVEYIESRKVGIFDYPFYWSDTMPDRVIIPFFYQGRLVGHTARKISEGRPKYLSDQTAGYVFNLDQQNDDRAFIIVVEGPMDALSVGGVALLGAEIMDKQSMQINQLDKEVILVPDRDKNGLNTIEQAIRLGWSVSLPDWNDEIKDTNDALRRYGKLYTLYSIINSRERSEVKIRLRTKTWINEQD